jgi:hypothetical protein
MDFSLKCRFREQEEGLLVSEKNKCFLSPPSTVDGGYVMSSRFESYNENQRWQFADKEGVCVFLLALPRQTFLLASRTSLQDHHETRNEAYRLKSFALLGESASCGNDPKQLFITSF